MKRLKFILPMMIMIFFSSCSSEEISSNGLTENEANNKKIEQKFSSDDSLEEKENIERVVLEQQSNLKYDDSIAIQYKDKKLVIKGNNEFDEIKEFNKYYKDIKIKEKISSFKFESIVVNEKKPVWYFDESKISSAGELNRIFKRDLDKDNIDNLKVTYNSIKGAITVKIHKQDGEKIKMVPNTVTKLIKREDSDTVYYIIEGKDDEYDGLVYEEKDSDGYIAYINLESYNQSNEDIIDILKLKGEMKKFFEKLNL